ncbi:hypothetical protein PUN28_000728 [Cardiocondyla obscurior]|uniref:Uncharacterized protein n=1 Tax=Cardiocondyla obscurior TaxID=286306 RepID=A0AAW2H0S5_9HYME
MTPVRKCSSLVRSRACEAAVYKAKRNVIRVASAGTYVGGEGGASERFSTRGRVRGKETKGETSRRARERNCEGEKAQRCMRPFLRILCDRIMDARSATFCARNRSSCNDRLPRSII